MNNILNFLRTAFSHASIYGEHSAPLSRAERRNKKFDRVTGR